MKQSNLPLIRRLTILLIISGTLNISLLAFLIYWNFAERPPTPYFEHLPITSNQKKDPLQTTFNVVDTWNVFSELPIEQLIAKLHDSQLIDGKHTQRDLALASLVKFHYFDLGKALQANRHKVSLKELINGQTKIMIFSGLSNTDFESIIQFARTEQWPITPHGMFLKLQNGDNSLSLQEAFYHTPYFRTVEMLFNRIEQNIKREELLELILQGPWDLIASFYSEQRALLDLTESKRQKFLLGYIEVGSPLAAHMLLKTSGKGNILQLKQEEIIKILSALNESGPEVIDLAISIIKTSKNVELLKAANDKLKTRTNIAEEPPRKKFYTVKEGDSLWKIAKHFRVSVNKLADANHLDESIIIQPGMQLVIP